APGRRKRCAPMALHSECINSWLRCPKARLARNIACLRYQIRKTRMGFLRLVVYLIRGYPQPLGRPLSHLKFRRGTVSREISDMFDDRTRVLQFADSASKTLSDFVWGELLTIPGSRSRADNRELFERSSFQQQKDVSTLDGVQIPGWAAEHQRRMHGEQQDS